MSRRTYAEPPLTTAMLAADLVSAMRSNKRAGEILGVGASFMSKVVKGDKALPPSRAAIAAVTLKRSAYEWILRAHLEQETDMRVRGFLLTLLNSLPDMSPEAGLKFLVEQERLKNASLTALISQVGDLEIAHRVLVRRKP